MKLDNASLEHIASFHTGGSGNGEYVSGRIQSIAKELLEFRKAKTEVLKDADIVHYDWVVSVEKPEIHRPVDFEDYQEVCKLLMRLIEK